MARGRLSSRPGAGRLARLLWGALALSLLLASCATSVPRLLRFDIEGLAARPPVVWPAAPEQARYSWVGQLVGEANFVPAEGEPGQAKKFLSWLAEILIGEDQRPVRIARPQGGVIDSAGSVYVTDAGNSAVFVFDRVAGELQVWDRAVGSTRFLSPVGIALGPGGDILVADSQLGIVARLDASGKPRGAIGKGVVQRPTGIAYDPAGRRIYVSDTAAHDIKVFDDSGSLLKTIGRRGEGRGEFNFPTHLAFAGGKLYVSDTMNSRIQVFSDEGAVVTLVFGTRGIRVGDLARAKGVAVDSQGNIYVVESYYNHLLVFSPRGELLLGIGGNGQGPGKFDLPAGVWLDASDRVFVADMLNARVAVFQYLGGGK